MYTSRAGKRKAFGRSEPAKKKTAARPPPSPSRVIHADDFEDLEDGPGQSGDGLSGVYDDPVIDREGPSASDQETDGEDGDGYVVDDEPDGFHRASEPEAGPSRGRSSGKNLYAPPTVEEMDRLRSAQEAGNTFTLQLEALLTSTLLPTTPHPSLKSLLSAIHDLMLSLPALPGVSPQAAVKRIGEIPFPGGVEWSPLKLEVQWTLGWRKPGEVVVGGSWGVCGGYKKGKGEMGGVDLVAVMPPELFSPKDRMGYRYFHKRAHYLAVIRQAVVTASRKEGPLAGVKVQWGVIAGDEKRPIVVLRAGKEQGLKYAVDINIAASLPPSVIPASTLQPSKSLLRISENTAPTPLYSTSILHDTLHKAHLLHLHRLSQLLPDRTSDSFLALWRIWAARRGISRSRGGSGWFAGLMLGWVVEGGEVGGQGGERAKFKRNRGLGKGLGYWGALRAAWEFLAHTDFAETPICLTTTDESVIPKTELVRAFDQLLVDPSGSVNVLAEWEVGDIELLRHHARETLAMLEDNTVDRFAEVFLRSHELALHTFDETIRLDISSLTFTGSGLQRAEHPDHAELLVSSISPILRRGLSNRAKLVHVSTTNASTLKVGIIYDPSHATRVIDIGPSSEKKTECETFRQLWGERAELRRFKDGSIAESVVWDLSRPEDAAFIPGRIVGWLVNRHFGINEDSVTCFSSDPRWLSIIQTPPTARDAISVQGSEKLGFRPIMDGYDELYRLLKSIDSDLPLAILHVTPADELLRYSSTFVPHPIDVDRWPTAPDCLKFLPKAEIVLQFESSPRWPDDLPAIQRVKLALMEKIARVIMERMPRSRAGVAFDPNFSEIEDHAALEVLLPRGVAFHVRIFHERERTLLQRIIDNDAPTFGTSTPRPPRRLAIPALTHHTHRFVHRPQHHSAMAPLHHRYPSFSSATRLLKRWFSAHMLSLQVRSEAIELLMARTYLDPGALQIPASATSGFVRTIEWLAGWDWRESAAFVPIFSATRDTGTQNGRVRFPSEKRTKGQTTFEGLRAKERKVAHSAWVVITEEDTQGLRWTDGVGQVVAGRVTALAKATLAALSASSLQGEMSIVSLFKTPTEDYDVVFHLNPSLQTRCSQAVEPDHELWESKLRFRNLADPGVYAGEVRVGFDPTESFARDIQRLYGDTVIVFYDAHGGQVIGLLWNPTKLAPRALKPFLGYSTRPVDSEAALVEINKEAVMAEIARLGKGLIKRVERRE